MTDSQPPRLLEQVRQAIQFKHFSLSTEKSYIYYVRQFILFHNKRHPREMGADEIRTYLSYLASEKMVAASTQNVALSALLFLYREVLRLELPYIEDIDRAKTPERVPVVSTKSEVKSEGSLSSYNSNMLSDYQPRKRFNHAMPTKYSLHCQQGKGKEKAGF